MARPEYHATGDERKVGTRVQVPTDSTPNPAPSHTERRTAPTLPPVQRDSPVAASHRVTPSGGQSPSLVPDSLRAVCAWCGCLIREGSEPTSHGICMPCAKVWGKK